MDPSALNSRFQVTSDHIREFREKGFVKLEKFFNEEAIEYFRDRVEWELYNAAPNFQDAFRRLKYDFESQKDVLYAIINQDFFQQALARITGRDLFFTFELCFELEKNTSQGFPWHVGVQSFGYQMAEDFGCTIWTTLTASGYQQAAWWNGLCPTNIVSGRFVYEDIEPALVSALEKKIEKGY